MEQVDSRRDRPRLERLYPRGPCRRTSRASVGANASSSRGRSGFDRIGKPFRELAELLRHAEQVAIRLLQPLVQRGLQAVQLASLLRGQPVAPALTDQLGA